EKPQVRVVPEESRAPRLLEVQEPVVGDEPRALRREPGAPLVVLGPSLVEPGDGRLGRRREGSPNTVAVAASAQTNARDRTLRALMAPDYIVVRSSSRPSPAGRLGPPAVPTASRRPHPR